MKKLLLSIILFAAVTTATSAQERYGNTLNVGVGLGYYSYYDHYSPAVFGINYEIDAARNFTLAPFITYYSYSNYYYWGDHNHPYKDYYYHVTNIPVGVKGTYYFDQLLRAGSDWDFYLAGSLGFAIRTVSWDNGYYGDQNVYVGRGVSPLYLDLHIGTEYHLSNAVGLYLDLSTGVSTIGLAFHLNHSDGERHERHNR